MVSLIRLDAADLNRYNTYRCRSSGLPASRIRLEKWRQLQGDLKWYFNKAIHSQSLPAGRAGRRYSEQALIIGTLYIIALLYYSHVYVIILFNW